MSRIVYNRKKIFSYLLFLIFVGFGVAYWYTGGGIIESIAPSEGVTKPMDTETQQAVADGTAVYKIGVVTWPGYLGGQYFNGGMAASMKSRYYTEYGFLVEFVLLDDFDISRNKFSKGEIDMLWITFDSAPAETGGQFIKNVDGKLVFGADWSRGGDAIVAVHGINSVQDLRGKRVAVAMFTPSHTFLIKMLEAARMTEADVEIVGVRDALVAAERFIRGSVDAAVVWSPSDAECREAIARSSVLINSKQASNIIADGFYASSRMYNQNFDHLCDIYEGWMIGSAELNTSNSARNAAIDILIDDLAFPPDYAPEALGVVRWLTHGDNKNIFGLNRNYNGVTAGDLYNDMSVYYEKYSEVPKPIPAWREGHTTKVIRAVDRRGTLRGGNHAAEGGFSFSSPQRSDYEREVIAADFVPVNFTTGSSRLDDNAKALLDIQFGSRIQQFGNTRIKITGHTDNTGTNATNIRLSKARAKSAKDYLVSKYRLDPDRILVTGEGSSSPVATNSTEAGRRQNRRIELALLK